MFTPPPFPTPEQLTEEQLAAAQRDAAVLRQLVQDKFKDGPNSGGDYWLKRPCGLNKGAYQVVAAELAQSGWKTRSENGRPGEDYWIISPA